MTKSLKYFFIAFLFGAPMWWGMNVFGQRLENFFYSLEMAGNPHLLAAQERQIDFWRQMFESRPLLRSKNNPDLDISAKSAIALLMNSRGKDTLLFEKDAEKRLPIASITKLMTAKIVLEHYNQNQMVEISEKAASLPGNGTGKLKAGQVFRAIDLLYPALMESNNTAAYSLAEIIGPEKFVEEMNLQAQKMEMENTKFLNPTGLDQDGQYSTVRDLAILARNLLERESFIWNILSLQEINLYSARGNFVYTVKNTNELLGKMPSIIGGKTGETKQAGGCLLLVTKAAGGRGYLINIILGSDDRFAEMQKLINWYQDAYIW